MLRLEIDRDTLEIGAIQTSSDKGKILEAQSVLGNLIVSLLGFVTFPDLLSGKHLPVPLLSKPEGRRRKRAWRKRKKATVCATW